MKSSTFMAIGLSLFYTSSAFIDTFLSYLAYSENHTRFIKYEANREIVDTFTTGSIPVITILISALCIAYLCCYLVPKFMNRNDGFKTETDRISNILIALVICLSLLHFFGGMTWHHDWFRYIFLYFGCFNNIVMGTLICAWIVYGYRVYKKEKEKKKNNIVY